MRILRLNVHMFVSVCMQPQILKLTVSATFEPFAMLDFLTIFSAVGLQQELQKAHGDQSLVIREDDASPSNLVESAAGHLADAMDAFDTAVSESFGAFLGGGQEEPQPAPKKA